MPHLTFNAVAVKRRLALLAVAIALHATPAPARDGRVEGVAVVDRIVLAGHDLTLNGAGLRTLWGFHVYVAALYLPEKARAATEILAQDVPRRMHITLLRDTTTEQNIDALKDGMIDNNSAAEMAAIDAELKQFFGLLKQVHEVPKGTVILFDYLPGRGTRLRIGDKDLGWIPGARFNLAVLRIWLGDDPIQTSLKKALLGLERPT